MSSNKSENVKKEVIESVSEEIGKGITEQKVEKFVLVIQENDAEKIHEETPVSFIGVLDSPLNWIQQRLPKKLIDQSASHIIVSPNDMSITLITEERNHFKNKIVGKLEDDPTFLEFAINTGKERKPEDWAELFKRHKYAFDSILGVNDLIKSLTNYEVKVNEETKKGKDMNGSEKASFERDVISSNLPSKFNVKIPIFKGKQPVSFECEFEVKGKNGGWFMSLWSDFIQVEQQRVRDEGIEEVVSKIREIAPEIVIFYK